ncbi:MAG: LysM peptidoglycan-binding domain-containing protein [Deinococcales bacterium]
MTFGLSTFVSAQQSITVQPGDTLSALATRYGTDVASIMAANELKSSQLKPGDILILKSNQNYQEVAVTWGDTVGEIAEKYDISVAELLAINGLSSVRIMVGDVVKVPVGSSSSNTNNFQLSPDNSRQQITVQEGQSLSSIATTHGLTLKELMEINQLSSARVSAVDILFLEAQKSPVIDESATLKVTHGLASNSDAAYKYIIVAEGERLSNIAAAYKLSLQELMAMNQLSSARIQAGFSLKVPNREAKVLAPSLLSNQQTSPQNSADDLAAAAENENALIPIEVNPGDTLGKIAAEYDMALADLMQINRLNSARLQIGDVLYVRSKLEEDNLASQITIEVKTGDTLSSLAKRYGTTTQAIMRANNLKGVYIYAGDKLVLPRNAENIQAALAPVEAAKEYTVQIGDSLHTIAYQYGLSVNRLIALNKLDGTTIYPGQVLNLIEQAEPLEPLRYAIRQGDTLSALASRYGVSVDDIARANQMSPLATLKIGQELMIPEHFGNELAEEAVLDRGSSASQSYVVQRGDTLYDLAKAYDTSIESLIVANRLQGNRIRTGQVLSIPSQGEFLTAATPTGSLESDNSLIWPLRGAITSRFGYRSLVINGRSYYDHTGLDIDGDTGDPIKAACDGLVVFSGWQGGYGQLVIVEKGNHRYYYAHASELLVSAGEYVSTGQVIAKVGSTGASTGSHLHFEIRVNGTPQDPLPFLSQAN